MAASEDADDLTKPLTVTEQQTPDPGLNLQSAVSSPPSSSPEPAAVTPGASQSLHAPTEYFNSVEGRAPEAGCDEQQDDPRHWSPLRQFVEVRKDMIRRQNGSHEEISEEAVRAILARQYGTTPAEVTGTQIRSELAGLLRQYPAIRLVSSKAASEARSPRKGPGNAAEENVPDANAPESAESVGRQIDRYREECRLTINALADGIRVTSRTADRHIADVCRPRPQHRAAYESLFSKLLKRRIIIKLNVVKTS